MGMTEEQWEEHQRQLNAEKLKDSTLLASDAVSIISGTAFEKGKIGGKLRTYNGRIKGGTKCNRHYENQVSRRRAKNKQARKSRRANRK